MDLTNQTVMIIGAGRGIGRAAAHLFAEAGARLALGSRNEAELMELEFKLARNLRADVLATPTDATQEDEVKKFVAETVARFGRIDVLVYAAGVGAIKPFKDMTVAELNRLLAVNTVGAFNALQAVLPVMETQKSGRVIALTRNFGTRADGASRRLLRGEIRANGNAQIPCARI